LDFSFENGRFTNLETKNRWGQAITYKPEEQPEVYSEVTILNEFL